MFRDAEARIQERLGAGRAALESLHDAIGGQTAQHGQEQEQRTVVDLDDPGGGDGAVEALAASLAASTSLIWGNLRRAGAGSSLRVCG